MTSRKLELETLLDVACPRAERTDVETFDRCYEAIKQTGCPSAQVLALHIINDLYSADSTDNANLNRISVNLDAAIDDLSDIRRRVGELG